MSSALIKNGSLVAAITDGSELMTSVTERERNVFARFTDSLSDAGTYWYGLIDKSDTTNWPHARTDRIDISTVGVGVDKSTAARGTLSLGVITRVDGTDADIGIIITLAFTQNDTPSIFQHINFAPSQMKCSVSNGALDKIKTAEVATGVTAINTSGGDLSFGSETFTPAVGDIVVRAVISAAGTLNFGVIVGYHGENPNAAN